jgi:DNA-binding NarL/FixJ family response regulator
MEGAPTNQIAMGLGLPETAVKDHIKSMLRKALSTTPPLKLVCRAEEAE